MELKTKNVLCTTLSNMWCAFSDATDARKKVDEQFRKLLECKNSLERIIDSKEHLSGDELRNIHTLINHIDGFYDIGFYPTYEDYEREASELDSLHERLEKQIEKEENK